MGALFLLFVAVPLVELWLLLKAGGTFGVGVTIGIVLLTGALGATLARREGLRALTRMTQAANKGILPTQAMFDGMAIFLGGALLLTPGFLTDAVGFGSQKETVLGNSSGSDEPGNSEAVWPSLPMPSTA